VTSPSDPSAGAQAFCRVLEEKAFRYILAKEAGRATRYQHFFSVCLVRPDRSASGDGEEMKRVVAEKIAELLRHTDIVGELDGETAILLLHTTDADALRVAERIRTIIGHVDFPGAAGRSARRITLSVGEASFPDHGASHRALLSRARAHLDEASRRGGNRVVHSLAD
jgi:diguanylate cyclase (GGDEF)-like protein